MSEVWVCAWRDDGIPGGVNVLAFSDEQTALTWRDGNTDVAVFPATILEPQDIE